VVAKIHLVLETPLYGKFVGENRRLVFAPTGPYVALVRGCVIAGLGGAVIGLLAPLAGIELPIYPMWWVMTGAMVGFAGVAAAFAIELVVFDLKERTYRRRQGPGLFPRTWRGRLSDLDAVVLISEPNSRLLNGGITYHLILHWKQQREVPLILQQDTRIIPPGHPLNAAAGPLHQRGTQYAKALGLPFYDNSHFPSANPVPILK
jgi:hypothetical protein